MNLSSIYIVAIRECNTGGFGLRPAVIPGASVVSLTCAFELQAACFELHLTKGYQ